MIRLSRFHWSAPDPDFGSDPTFTITVSGFHDAYRLAHHLCQGQSEFADIGFKMIRRLRRRMDRSRWAYQMRAMHGLPTVDWRDRPGSPFHVERLAVGLERIRRGSLTGPGRDILLAEAAEELYRYASQAQPADQVGPS